MGFLTAKTHFQQCLTSLLKLPRLADEIIQQDYQKRERENLYKGLIDLTQGLEELRVLIKQVKK